MVDPPGLLELLLILCAAPVTRHLEPNYREVRFVNGLAFNASGELVIHEDPEQAKYLGPPTDESDAAWRELMACKWKASTKIVEAGSILTVENQLTYAATDIFLTPDEAAEIDYDSIEPESGLPVIE